MRENHYLEKTVMAGWQFLSGDVSFMDYGGRWYRMVGDGIYHAIDLINMEEHGETDRQFRYHVTLAEIVIDHVDTQQVRQEFGIDTINDAMLVDYAMDYGSYIHLADYSGSNYRLLLQHAKRESKAIATNDVLHLQKLQRSVNRLGSTALEMALGDIHSGMIRGIAMRDDTARLVGRIHGLDYDAMDAVESNAVDFSLTCEEEYTDILGRMKQCGN